MKTVVLALLALVCLAPLAGAETPQPNPYLATPDVQLRQLAENGDAEAQYLLATRLLEAQGHSDAAIQTARPWLERAAQQGHAEAANYLGAFSRDEAAARQWFEKAAAAGSPGGKLNLALRLLDEQSLESQRRAVKLLKEVQSLENWRQPTQEPLGRVYLFGLGGEPKNISLGLDFFERALVTQPRDVALNWILGKAYWYGNGRDQNYDEAFTHLKVAADAGHPAAAWHVGMALLNGLGTQKDEPAAFDYVCRAADGGYLDGQISKAVMLALGQGVAVDRPAARSAYLVAAKRGSAHAMRGLGGMLFVGEGGEAEPASGQALLELASEGGDDVAKTMLHQLQANEDRAAVEARKQEWKRLLAAQDKNSADARR